MAVSSGPTDDGKGLDRCLVPGTSRLSAGRVVTHHPWRRPPGSDEPEGPTTLDGGLAGGDVELAIQALRMALDGVDRDEHRHADLALRPLTLQGAQDGQLAIGEGFDGAARGADVADVADPQRV